MLKLSYAKTRYKYRTLISKNRLKELAAYRLQKRCDEEAVFVVEGPKMAAEAMAAAVPLRAVCATGEWIERQKDTNFGNAELFEVSPAELERLSAMKSPNQVWMLAERTSAADAALSATTTPFTLALDRIQDPGNLGTMLRTADWFGVRHVVCSRDTASCFNPKAVQATMGAIFRTRVEYVDLPAWLDGCGQPVYGASLHGQSLAALQPGNSAPAVLVIGNESRGISPEVMARVSQPVLIPNLGGTAESLNAAVAAGILINWLSWNNYNIKKEEQR